MSNFFFGLALGFIIACVLCIESVSRIGTLDIERGWSYLGGEKYFLTLDRDEASQ